MGIKITYGQSLQFRKKIITDLFDHILRDGEHQAALGIACDDADQVYGSQEYARYGNIRHDTVSRMAGRRQDLLDNIIRNDFKRRHMDGGIRSYRKCETVNDRSHEIAADQGCDSADQHTGQHQDEASLVTFHV